MNTPQSTLSPLLGSRNITLHIWPPHDDLLSPDVSSVAALLYLQLTIPGHFSVAHCTNPDLSPSGQLPFLTHGIHHVSGVASIIAYVRKLPNALSPDALLNSVETAQLTARVAHVESSYGDLVNHMLYSLQENWSGITAPALVSMLPLPQRYYVPSRIRLSHKARLEAVELWHVPEVEEEEEEPRKVFGRKKKTRLRTGPSKFKTVFEREKVVEKARAVFDVYGRLLGEHHYFMGSNAPTTLDIVFAAHTHMLLNADYPDPLVSSVLKESYPHFVGHCKRVTAAAESSYVPPTVRRDSSSILASSPAAKKEEWRYKLWRWGFIGASVLAAAAYLHFTTIVVVIRPRNAIVAPQERDWEVATGEEVEDEVEAEEEE